MTTCEVLRCQETATTTHLVVPELSLKSLVCATHKEKMEAGEPWTLADVNVIHMGADIAPRLVTFKASVQGGTEGFTLQMELDAAGQPRSQSIFITDDMAKDLLFYLNWRAGTLPEQDS
ncbi:MAG: hypothetical protein WBZ57_20640 [Pseudomonas graminis]